MRKVLGRFCERSLEGSAKGPWKVLRKVLQKFDFVEDDLAKHLA